MSTITIAIADDEELFRRGIKLILEGFPGLKVKMQAGNGIELLDQLKVVKELPDILLLDLNMPEMNGIEVARRIRADYSEIKIIVLSTHFSRSFIINMIELSAGAYLPKNSLPDEVVSTIKSVHENGFHYSDHVLAAIRENMISPTKSKSVFSFDLTSREKEVLQLICEQYSAPEIAEKLFVSPRTVDGHRNNLLSKLNCKNVAGLVVFAMHHQIVKVPPTINF